MRRPRTEAARNFWPSDPFCSSHKPYAAKDKTMNKIIQAGGLAIALASSALAGAPTAFAQGYDNGYYDNNGYQTRIEQDRRDYDARWGRVAYDRYYSRHEGYSEQSCRNQKSNNQLAGGLLGGLAGAAIGSNLASGGGRTGGAVIGGVAGAVVGSNIAKGEVHCN
jgi:hypothetical protein